MADMHAMGTGMHKSTSPIENPQAAGPPSTFTPEGIDATNNFGWDMISLGLEEPLPAREVMDELYVPMPIIGQRTLLILAPGTEFISKRLMPSYRLYTVLDLWPPWTLLLTHGLQHACSISSGAMRLPSVKSIRTCMRSFTNVLENTPK
jgi:hypothetical protein